MKDAKEIRRQKDAERRKKKWEEKKKQDEAELNKAAETLDALITSGPPPTETVAWTPLSAELKELLFRALAQLRSDDGTLTSYTRICGGDP